jgi:tRNA nucleotidyltransferase (CCA-adding enzyme)
MLGRHLMDLGAEPGPQFGALLDAAYEAQLDGTFTDEKSGIEFLQQKLKDSSSK